MMKNNAFLVVTLTALSINFTFMAKLDGFKYTENYFTKANKADAVQISQEGSALVSMALKLVAKDDFEGAAENAREAIAKCKACHDIYRPRLSR
jgi:hypothetical protein